MDIALWFIIATLSISSLYAVVLMHEYLRVTRKRREFIASLGGSGRAVPRLKHTLMSVYIMSTLCWTVGFLYYFFTKIQ